MPSKLADAIVLRSPKIPLSAAVLVEHSRVTPAQFTRAVLRDAFVGRMQQLSPRPTAEVSKEELPRQPCDVQVEQ